MMKLPLVRTSLLVLFFSLFIPLSVNAADEHIIPSTYIDVGITTGIALDSDENIYVVDNMNSKIMVFNPAGELVRNIGRLGSGDGDFVDAIHEITIDNNDYLYISGECHVYKFSPSGSFVSRWGECGNEEGNFGSVRGIDYDESQNRILVSDTGNNRVQVFTKGGVFVDSFGSFGTGNGQFKQPFGLTTDTNGNIFVVDSDNHRVQKFNKEFAFLNSFGVEGVSDGNFLFPKDIKIASNGDLIITSQNSQKIVIYSSSLVFISEFGESGGEMGQFSVPQYLELDSDDNIYITDWYRNNIQKFTSEGVFDSMIGNARKTNGSFFNPSAIVYDAIGNMYVLDDGAGAGRVQKFTNAGVYIDTIISEGLYDSSYHMSIDSSDNLYISGEDGVQVFDTDGTPVRVIGEYGVGVGQFTQARGMDFDADGNIYIADYFDSVVNVFDSTGVYLSSIGSQGDGAGQFVAPDAVLVDDVGEFIYVSDSNNDDVFPSELEIARIQKFDLDGNYISTIVSAGENWEDYLVITDLKMDALGNIYVVDQEKHHVKYIDNTGTLLDTYGTYGSGLDQFNYPTGIAINPLNDLISIADTFNHRIFLKPGGTRIFNLSSEIDVLRIDNGESVANSYVESDDPDIASLSVMLYSTVYPIASFNVNLTVDRDWSSVSVATLPEKAKVLVENLDEANAPGISATKDIYIPKYEGQEKLLVCPSATTILEIELGCTGESVLNTESAGVTVENIDEQDYWVVSDTDDNGFMSYSTTSLRIDSDDNTIYINETLNVTITPLTESDVLDTNYVGDVEVVSSPYFSVSHSVVPIDRSAEPIQKEITFTQPGVYTIIAEDVDDPTLRDTLENITVLGIEDSTVEEEDEDDDDDSYHVYATRELSCTEDPSQVKCTVLSSIEEVVFTRIDDSSAKICWNQSIAGDSYLQLTEKGQPVGEKFLAETVNDNLYCANIFGLTSSGDYEYVISISEVKEEENISGSYEGTFSMKEETTTTSNTTDNSVDDLEKDDGGNNLKKILIITGVAIASLIFLFIILKRKKKEEEEARDI